MSYKYRSTRNSGQRRSSFSTSNSGGNNRRGQYINPSRFVKAAVSRDVEQYAPTHQFSDFGFNDLISANLASKGFITPTPIQDQAIPIAMQGKDIIGVANTGTGKTAAFALPIIQKMMANRSSRALVIAPTRELAEQIEQDFKTMARGSGMTGALLIGGAGMGQQLASLRRNPNIVLGTPGRIKDHLERRSLDLSSFDTIVLDEVDRMLDMGFINDVRHILGHLANERQSYFFSATLDGRVSGLVASFAKDPVTISLKTGDTSENVNQDIVSYGSSDDKMTKLHDILISGAVEKVIVFDETQRKVERLSKDLKERGFSVDAIHGGKTQGHRQRALRRFKENEINILVATDVAARGIDVIDITHVINFSTPQSYEDYVHRIGRAGRAGRVGHALTFVTA